MYIFIVDDLLYLDKTKEHLDKTFINNAILYLHSKFLPRTFQRLYSLLSHNGKLYLFD